ncbi:hypothetical protein J6590_032562 [Homalodisca vitripennis]|nr:hypothetical protein J6590_032562 [Homalodisca vitripennis]
MSHILYEVTLLLQNTADLVEQYPWWSTPAATSIGMEPKTVRLECSGTADVLGSAGGSSPVGIAVTGLSAKEVNSTWQWCPELNSVAKLLESNHNVNKTKQRNYPSTRAGWCEDSECTNVIFTNQAETEEARKEGRERSSNALFYNSTQCILVLVGPLARTQQRSRVTLKIPNRTSAQAQRWRTSLVKQLSHRVTHQLE